jgi:hypothetical protein
LGEAKHPPHAPQAGALTWPNQALEPTASSVRSCLVPGVTDFGYIWVKMAYAARDISMSVSRFLRDRIPQITHITRIFGKTGTLNLSLFVEG